jgi:hypothetical protein
LPCRQQQQQQEQQEDQQQQQQQRCGRVSLPALWSPVLQPWPERRGTKGSVSHRGQAAHCVRFAVFAQQLPCCSFRPALSSGAWFCRRPAPVAAAKKGARERGGARASGRQRDGSNEQLSNERDSAELHLALVADAHCLEVMLLQKRLQARSRGRRIEFDLEVL